MENFTRVNNNSSGNPRYVVHFLELLPKGVHSWEIGGVSEAYATALTHAKKHGGKKYHCRAYGGGVAFQVWNPAKDLAEKVEAIRAEFNKK